MVSAKVEALIKKTDTTLTVKSLVRLIVDLTEDVSHANVSHWKKDELRNTLKGLKKKVDDLERLAKAAVITEVAKATEKLVVELAKEPFIVHQFHAFSNTKVPHTTTLEGYAIFLKLCSCWAGFGRCAEDRENQAT